VLEEIPGVGPGKRRALLRELGSLRAVREASLERLRAVSGLSARDADAIRAFFDGLAPPETGEALETGDPERGDPDSPREGTALPKEASGEGPSGVPEPASPPGAEPAS
jgi:excinuclease ABC subunit C